MVVVTVGVTVLVFVARAAAHQHVDIAPVAGYTSQPGDCGYPVCATITQVTSTNLSYIASVCNNTAGCEGFNSNGWLKGCLPPRCPAGQAGMEPTAPCNLYTKEGDPKPLPPPAPVPDIEDPFYPAEEGSEFATANIPTVVSITSDGLSCMLSNPTGGAQQSASVGSLVFQNWSVVAILPESGPVYSQQPALVVMERRWQKWGLIVYVSVRGDSKWDRTIRKPLGYLNMTQNFRFNFTASDSAYFQKAANDPSDFLGGRIVADSQDGEASYLTAAKFLPPIKDYVVIGDINTPVKAVVTMNGKIKRSDGTIFEPPLEGGTTLTCITSADCIVPPRDRSYCYQGQCIPGGGIVFDGAAYFGFDQDFSEQQAGVLGGHLRVASVGCFNKDNSTGFEMMSIGPLDLNNDTLLVAIRKYSNSGPLNSPYDYLSVSLDRRPCEGQTSSVPYCAGGKCCEVTAESFYSAVAAHSMEWSTSFQRAMQASIPYTERRQLDMAKGVIVSTSTVYSGNEPNYGTGVYWKSSPPVRAMMDTVGVPGSLPLTTLAFNDALLRWGMFDSALAKIGFYLDNFVFANGTIDMGHWKDIWPDGGDGQYNCTYPDGLTDMGKIVQLYVDAVRLSKNTEWMGDHLPPVIRIGKYLLQARSEALSAFPVGDPRHGMIYGPAEHDTCEMGMGTSPPIVDGQYMLYYFSVSMWYWRGMVELGNLLNDFVPSEASLANELLNEAQSFKADIDKALNASSVRNTSGILEFVPAAVVPAGTKPTRYMSMTTDTLASYSNFRYFSEMLSSGAMSSEYAVALMEFREQNGGCLSGMTRYTDHLDDMPALGYAESSLDEDRIEQFLLLLYGHAANYQGRGSFFSDEQQSLYQDENNIAWRSSLGDLQASFCTPSQMLISSMTAMQLISFERDEPTIWIARGAPRRWYSGSTHTTLFGASQAPTRWGLVNYSLSTMEAETLVNISVNFSQPGNVKSKSPTLMVRVRGATSNLKLANAFVSNTTSPVDCIVENIIVDTEIVRISPTPEADKAAAIVHCTIIVTFKDSIDS